jgi:hypothetical protein
MSAIEIKTELQQLITQEKDMRVLKTIHTILRKASLDPMLREKLTSKTLKSERDMAEGRLFDNEKVTKRIPSARKGWGKPFKQMHENGDDKLLMTEV